MRASARRGRAMVWRVAGPLSKVLPPGWMEPPPPGNPPQELVRRLAESKAQLVTQRGVGPALIIAADTDVAVDGRALGKPRSADEAREMLRALSGRTHNVHTGLAVIRLPDEVARLELETTEVTFAPLSDEDIAGYIATGEPFDKAGAYAIQGGGGRFVTRVEGCHFNVVGLPLARLLRILRELGWRGA